MSFRLQKTPPENCSVHVSGNYAQSFKGCSRRTVDIFGRAETPSRFSNAFSIVQSLRLNNHSEIFILSV
jgi:hypothetical protein